MTVLQGRVMKEPASKKEKPKNECARCGQAHRMCDEHPRPTTVIHGKSVYRFGSGGKRGSPAQMLSNFWKVPVVLDRDEVSRCAHIMGTTFPSFPHLAFDGAEFAYVYLTVDANEGLLAGGSLTVFDCAKRAAHWGNCTGVLAKQYGNKLRKARAHAYTMEQKYAIWHIILHAKYRNQRERAALVGTGDAHLLELTIGAVIRQISGKGVERWGGWDHAVQTAEHHIWGENHMGKMLMRVRAELQGSIV